MSDDISPESIQPATMKWASSDTSSRSGETDENLGYDSEVDTSDFEIVEPLEDVAGLIIEQDDRGKDMVDVAGTSESSLEHIFGDDESGSYISRMDESMEGTPTIGNSAIAFGPKMEQVWTAPDDLPSRWQQIKLCLQHEESREAILQEWRGVTRMGVLILVTVLSTVFLAIGHVSPDHANISINSKSMPVVSITSTSQSTTTAGDTQGLLAVPVSDNSPTTMVTPSKETLIPTNHAFHGSHISDVSLDHALFGLTSTSDSKICNVELIDERNILLRIPPGIGHNTISVSMTRGDVDVGIEHAYAVIWGYILQLSVPDAHGSLNLTITTTKHPRINENFQIDFGTSPTQAVRNAVNKLGALDFDMVVSYIQEKCRCNMTWESFSHDLENSIRVAAEDIAYAARVTTGYSISVGAKSGELIKSLGEKASRTVAATYFTAQQHFSLRKSFVQKAARTTETSFSHRLLQAQIKSRILWLRVIGRHEEAEVYKHKASEFIRMQKGEGNRESSQNTRKADRKHSKCSKSKKRTQ